MDKNFAYLMQNPRLFRAVLDFNGFYEPPDFGLPEKEKLVSTLKSRPALWRLFPRKSASAGLWCFESPENRLALLPLQTLERLATYWSAVVLAELFAKTLDGKALRHIKTALEPEVFDYAVRHGRFLLGSLRSAWLPPAAEKLSDATLRYPGRKLIALCLALWPEELRATWLARWRPDHKTERPPTGDPILLQAIWPPLQKLLLTEVAPEWLPCFNS
jgi:hypothetical protein